MNEVNNLKGNRIHFSNHTYSKKLISYSSVGKFGTKLDIKSRTEYIDGEMTRYQRINLLKTKKRMIAITRNQSEVLNV